jgi:MFS family permease
MTAPIASEAPPAAPLGRHDVGWSVVRVFAAFALVYFLSALLRAVTATLAPVFSDELALNASQLGLLAGAYFLGFAVMQLPVGQALDNHGPKRVVLVLLAVAVVGCAAFALARTFTELLLSRALIGIGVSACLMAPLTHYRRQFTPSMQLRANSWMLMTGSLGMVASTVPVQWLLPGLGWRGLFWLLAALLLLGILVLAWLVPTLPRAQPVSAHEASGHGALRHGSAYGEIVRSPIFLRLAPMGFFLYGGLVAVQALWAGPWLTRVAGQTAAQAAGGLLLINACMLLAFFAWGAAMPRLHRHGVKPEHLMSAGLPVAVVGLGLVAYAGPAAGAWSWAAWCVACSVVALSQPAVGQAFAEGQAGRALSAFNLVIFSGVFAVQWGIGLAIDAATAAGLEVVDAHRLAFGGFALLSLASYLWFVWRLARSGNSGRP